MPVISGSLSSIVKSTPFPAILALKQQDRLAHDLHLLFGTRHLISINPSLKYRNSRTKKTPTHLPPNPTSPLRHRKIQHQEAPIPRRKPPLLCPFDNLIKLILLPNSRLQLRNKSLQPLKIIERTPPVRRALIKLVIGHFHRIFAIFDSWIEFQVRASLPATVRLIYNLRRVWLWLECYSCSLRVAPTPGASRYIVSFIRRLVLFVDSTRNAKIFCQGRCPVNKRYWIMISVTAGATPSSLNLEFRHPRQLRRWQCPLKRK